MSDALLFVQLSLPIGYGKLPTKAQLDFAKQRAGSYETMLTQMGYTVLNPFSFPSRIDFSYHHYLDVCKRMMFAFNPIVFFATGYEYSGGCKEEYAYATEIGLRIRREQDGALLFMAEEFKEWKDRCAYYELQTGLNT